MGRIQVITDQPGITDTIPSRRLCRILTAEAEDSEHRSLAWEEAPGGLLADVHRAVVAIVPSETVRQGIALFPQRMNL